MENHANYRREELPNSTLILILGISSIVGCCFSYGLLGLICAVIALVLAKSANQLYRSDPERYTESSYKNMTTGKTCAIVSLVLSIVLIVFAIIAIIVFGWAVLTNPGSYLDQYQVYI